MSSSPSQTPDGPIIEAVLAGQTERFTELVQRYRGPLLRLAQSRLGREDWAEDVVQETFLCTFKSLASYDSRYSFRTWLWTILLNQCRRHQRRHGRQPRVWSWSDRQAEETSANSVIESPPSSEVPPPAMLLNKERDQQLESLLNQLPDNQADALRLRFYGGLKYREIAETMGCSLGSAKNRVRWGLSKMSQMMIAGELR